MADKVAEIVDKIKELSLLEASELKKALEEELRLLYVAATRAKQNLYLVKPDIKSVGGNYYERTYQKLTEVSRFLSDGKILDDFVEKWALSDE